MRMHIYIYQCDLVLQASSALAAMKADENVSKPDVSAMAYIYIYVYISTCFYVRDDSCIHENIYISVRPCYIGCGGDEG